MLSHLGDTQRAIGNPQEARDSWRHALAILDTSHDPGAGEVRAKLRGLALAEGRDRHDVGVARSRSLASG